MLGRYDAPIVSSVTELMSVRVTESAKTLAISLHCEMTRLARSCQSGMSARCPLSLLKNVFGVGVGRWMIAAETYSWAGQYIGDVCERCEINENSGHRCV